MPSTRNLRVASLRPLLGPATLYDEIPITDRMAETVSRGRDAVAGCLHGRDDRVVVVVGPCSIHDPAAGVEYGTRLLPVARELADELVIVMRVYFEKPRTTVGWKGLINDPDLDGSFRINEGLRKARRLLADLNDLGLPCGCELLDPISPQFISGLVSWGAIGARTTESQVHRELASGLSMPVGFKNGTRGTVQIAVDAVTSAKHAHHFLGVTEEGQAAIVETTGNPDCHVILRGGSSGPNYDAASITSACAALEAAGLVPSVMVDCSHGNSDKRHEQQAVVARTLGEQLAQGSTGVFGVMLESFLVAGRQELGDGKALTYGQSVTDACLGWDATRDVLVGLARAVAARRSARSTSPG